MTNYYFTMNNGRISEFSLISKDDTDVARFKHIFNNKKINIKRNCLILKSKETRCNKYCRHPIYEFEKDGLYFRWHQNTDQRKLYKRIK